MLYRLSLRIEKQTMPGAGMIIRVRAAMIYFRGLRCIRCASLSEKTFCELFT